jgi:hypothetical protein
LLLYTTLYMETDDWCCIRFCCLPT